MTDATIVVEAKQKGGALITAGLADSYNRPVFAVPGNIGMANSEGCNMLIRNQKALIYTAAKDLSYYLNWDEAKGTSTKQTEPPPELTQDESVLFRLLSENANGINIDDLSWRSGIPVNKLASVLLSLEFKGLVTASPGKKYKISG